MATPFDGAMPKKIRPGDPGFNEEVERRLRDALADLLDTDTELVVEKLNIKVEEDDEQGGYTATTIWNRIMQTVAGNTFIERYWVASNDDHYGCHRECPAHDGALVWISPADIAKQDPTMPDDIWQERLNAIMVTTVDDHSGTASIARMSPQAAQELHDALGQALAMLNGRKK